MYTKKTKVTMNKIDNKPLRSAAIQIANIILCFVYTHFV